LRRAKALAHILENMNLYIRPGELIIGNFAANPDAVCHYPEFQYKWVERETAKGRVFEELLSDEEREELKEINSYWKNLAIHNIYGKYVPEELKGFTQVFNFECATPNYERVLRLGLKGIIEKIEKKKQALKAEYPGGNMNAMDYVNKIDFLDAAVISLNAAITWGKRYAALAKDMALAEDDLVRKAELEEIAKICDHVPENPARNLHEAIQCFWFIHLIVNFIEIPMVGDGIRFDMVMGPYYDKDVKAGRIDYDQAQELVECLFVKSQETGFLHPPIWSGQGGGAIGYQTLNIGGVDADGNDVTNDVSLIVLDAMKDIRTVTPPLALRWHDNIPKKLVDKAIECMATGMPQPAIFNDKVNIPRLTDFGTSLEDARNYSINNCMVPTIPGKQLNHRSAWANALVVPLCLTAALGLDILPGFWKRPMGNPMPNPENIGSMEELLDATIENCAWLMRQAAEVASIGDALYQKLTPRPFLSAVLDDCIERAQDVRDWNWGFDYREIIVLGLNNAADSLAAVKRVVFDDKKATMAELIEALKNNWEGHEDLRQLCLEAPKFGNDDDYVDLITFELGKR
ncbi:MAG: pyruvate formate lyase family protein, partial [Thermodesulfobacteriota bacterium]|nr:pyruvate formate lyase family protein [Thermodesulfobacteriota bacterium]